MSLWMRVTVEKYESCLGKLLGGYEWRFYCGVLEIMTFPEPLMSSRRVRAGEGSFLIPTN